MPLVSAFPDVITERVTSDHEFVVLACDGIWDVMSNEEVVEFCRDRLAAGRDPEVVCEELLSRCLAPDCQMGGLGCDNMTVVLVCFTHGEGQESVAKHCSRPARQAPKNEEEDEVTPSPHKTNANNTINSNNVGAAHHETEDDEAPPNEFTVKSDE